MGRALATALAAAGARVVGLARRSEALEAWRAETQGDTAAISADLSDPGAMIDVAVQASQPFGAPDILINAAEINTRQIADHVTLEDWQNTLNLNLATPFFLAQALAPAMRTKGWGRIVNFASLQTVRAFPGGIAANALAPGFFPTELTGPVFDDPEMTAKNARQTCIGRNGELADLIGPALFLCSAASDYVTGQILYVDGGFTAK